MRLGVDFGGTKIEGALLDSRGEILVRRRAANPGDYDGAVRAVADLTARIEHEAGHRAQVVGVGIPGSPSPATGLVRNSNSIWLNGKPFVEDLKAALGRPVRVENDANCFALSEAVDGAAAHGRVVFGVILGTGVGGGIVVDGRVLEGANGVAGEWGHNPMPAGPDTEGSAPPPCYCGRAGCIETWLSGPALAADHRRVTGEPLAPEQIVRRAAAGDAACAATLARYEIRLARALAGVINLLDPQVIVLGGGLSALPGLYERVPQHWMPHVFFDLITTRLCPPVHGGSSGVRGAAWLW